jgi:hypothetical protein
MSKIQNSDVKSESELIAAGATKSSLINDSKIYVSANSINKTLDDAITDGDIGSGGGGVGGINYIDNYDFEKDTNGVLPAGWATYSDAAGLAPVDGTGGTPNTTFLTTTTTPLRGINSSLVTKNSGASRQGEGVSYDFTIDSADQAQVLRISFDYNTSVNYADGDIRIYVYDVTNSRLIEVVDRDLYASSFGKFVGTFQTSPDSTSYRLIFHIASVSALAYTVEIDNVIVGPQTIVKGAIVTDWEPSSITTAITNTTIIASERRNGDTISIKGTITCSGTPGGSFTLGLPYTIDTSKISYNSSVSLGILSIAIGASRYFGYVRYSGSTSATLVVDTGSVISSVSPTVPATFVTGSTLNFEVSYSVLGWSSNVVLSEDAGNREIVLLATDVAGTLSSTSFAYNDLNFTVIQKDSTSSYSVSGYTVPESGEYDISLSCAITYGTAPVAGNDLSVGVKVNGSDYIVSFQKTTGTTSQYYPSGNWTVSLTKGDLITPYVRKQGAETLTFLNATDNRFQYFSVAKRSSPQTIAASEVVAAKYYGSTTTVTSSSLNPQKFNTPVFDTHNAYNTTTGYYTVPQSGVYRISANIGFNATTSATGRRNLLNVIQSIDGVTFSNTGIIGSYAFQVIGTFDGSVNGSTLLNLAKGSIVYISAAHGSNITDFAPLNTTETSFSIEKVG